MKDGNLPDNPTEKSTPQAGPAFEDDDSGRSPAAGGRQEPVFSDFDDEDSYEESDRDNDFVSAYEDDDPDDEDFDGLEVETEAATADWRLSGGGRGWQDAGAAPDENDPLDNSWSDEDDEDEDEDDESDTWQESEPAEPLYQEMDDNADWEAEDTATGDQNEYPDEAQESSQGWPLGMIGVALVALVLLAAGGYGVMQQRSAAEDEIRQLQASLATAANPAEVATMRAAVQAAEQSSAAQAAAIDSLTSENQRLAGKVAGLESRLEAERQRPAKAVAPAKPAATVAKAAKPARAETPTVAASSSATPAAAAGTGRWFVNFGSYNQQAIAQSWAKRLQPATGKVVVTSANRDGSTFYRVRVVGLSDRQEAERVSRQLEDKYKLPKLWVGKQ